MRVLILLKEFYLEPALMEEQLEGSIYFFFRDYGITFRFLGFKNGKIFYIETLRVLQKGQIKNSFKIVKIGPGFWTDFG